MTARAPCRPDSCARVRADCACANMCRARRTPAQLTCAARTAPHENCWSRRTTCCTSMSRFERQNRAPRMSSQTPAAPPHATTDRAPGLRGDGGTHAGASGVAQVDDNPIFTAVEIPSNSRYPAWAGVLWFVVLLLLVSMVAAINQLAAAPPQQGSVVAAICSVNTIRM